MLISLTIKNFALIESLHIPFYSGLTALTGETGAGKSILLDALSFVLGEKADNEFVRTDCDSAEIIAKFDIKPMVNVQNWLINNQFSLQEHCTVKRIIKRAGRSSAYIENKLVSASLLEDLGNLLVEIHGQHAYQSLLHKDRQRDLLDNFGQYPDLLKQVFSTYKQWQTQQKQLDMLKRQQQERHIRQTWLQEQITILQELQLQENEFEQLQYEQQRLAHAEKLIQGAEFALNQLYYADPNALTLIQKTITQMERLLEHDLQLEASKQLLSQTEILLQESIDEIRSYFEGLESDPERLAWIEQRLHQLQNLAYKYQVLPEELSDFHKTLITELEQLSHLDEDITQLVQQVEENKQAYFQIAQQLSESRQIAAERFSQAITAAMQTLSLKGAQLDARLEILKEPNALGLERVEFYLQSNFGQPFKTLAKIASGGELSRISLAIYMVCAEQSNTPSLIFDEVDTGISGGVAEIVGKHLRKLGNKCQVLCVTHLPQVAAQSHQHIKISKTQINQETISKIELLSPEARTLEIARMLGGIDLTAQTLAHAEEMLNRAKLHP